MNLTGPVKAPRRDPALLPCPFCGSSAEIEPWHGGKPTKRVVSCCGEECPVAPCVTGETRKEAIDNWNRRAPLPAAQDRVSREAVEGLIRSGIETLRVGWDHEKAARMPWTTVDDFAEGLRQAVRALPEEPENAWHYLPELPPLGAFVDVSFLDNDGYTGTTVQKVGDYFNRSGRIYAWKERGAPAPALRRERS